LFAVSSDLLTSAQVRVSAEAPGQVGLPAVGGGQAHVLVLLIDPMATRLVQVLVVGEHGLYDPQLHQFAVGAAVGHACNNNTFFEKCQTQSTIKPYH